MDILFEPYPINDGEISARPLLDAVFTDATDFVRSRLDLIGSLAGTQTNSGVIAAQLTPLTAAFFDTANGIFRNRLPLDSNWSSNSLAPSIAIFVASLPQLKGSFAGTQTNIGQITSSLPLQSLLSSEPDYFHSRLPIQTYFSDGTVQMDRIGVLLQQPQLYSDMVQGFTIIVSENFDLGAAGDLQQIMARAEALGIDGANTSKMTMLESIHETIGFSELAFVVWNIIANEALTLAGDDVAATRIVMQVAESLALLGGANSAMAGLTLVREALAIGASHGYVWPVNILEQLGARADAAWMLLALPHQTEALVLSGNDTGYVNITALVDEGLLLGDAVSSSAELLNLINEGVEFLMRIGLPDGEFIAWVCNTESKAFCSYRNFPFNSFAEIGGHYYGCTDTGVYLLEGDDDAGEPIAARLRTGLMDMGTGLFKRMDTMYLGYRATGDLVLKVVVLSPEGQKQEVWYSLAPRPSQDLVTSRAKIGKGLKSTYWAFEIANVDGADFEIDTMSFLPLVLERRI